MPSGLSKSPAAFWNSARSPFPAIKNRSGKLTIPEADIHETLADLDIRILPYTREHAFRLFALPWHHTDPFDRQILAQALAEGIPIVTSDEMFGLYEGIRVIW